MLGTSFSVIYPTVETDFNLAFLFSIIGLLIVLTIRFLWRAIRKKKS